MQAYPLCWPAGWPRIPRSARVPGRFSRKIDCHAANGSSWKVTADLTIGHAVRRIEDEIGLMGAGLIAISSNLRVRRDGLPRAGQAQPDDPGVAVYLEVGAQQRCVPCDRYTRVEQNLAGAAAVLSALRALERHGSDIMERAFTGFAALPAPGAGDWRAVLGAQVRTVAEAKARFRELARGAHPDRGGSQDAFSALQAAYARAVRELGSSA